MKNISSRWMITLGAYAIIIGCLLYVFTGNQEPQYPTTDEPTSEEIASQPAVSPQATATHAQAQLGTPVRIQVLEADINLTVSPGVYNQKSQTWTLTTKKAHFAVMTAKPNQEGGNTFIYGHNRPSVFARLTKIKPGSVAIVTTDNNQRFTYRMRDSHTTKPEDSSVLYYSGPPILTLQTCTGAMFQNRTLYVFDLIGVTNA